MNDDNVRAALKRRASPCRARIIGSLLEDPISVLEIATAIEANRRGALAAARRTILDFGNQGDLGDDAFHVVEEQPDRFGISDKTGNGLRRPPRRERR